MTNLATPLQPECFVTAWRSHEDTQPGGEDALSKTRHPELSKEEHSEATAACGSSMLCVTEEVP